MRLFSWLIGKHRAGQFKEMCVNLTEECWNSVSSGSADTKRELFRRCVIALKNPAAPRIDSNMLSQLFWYAGRFGLATGVAPRECLSYLEQGKSISPIHDHDVVKDTVLLRYALALIEDDRETAQRIRYDNPQDTYIHFYDDSTFNGHFEHLIKSSESLPDRLLEVSANLVPISEPASELNALHRDLSDSTNPN